MPLGNTVNPTESPSWLERKYDGSSIHEPLLKLGEFYHILDDVIAGGEKKYVQFNNIRQVGNNIIVLVDPENQVIRLEMLFHGDIEAVAAALAQTIALANHAGFRTEAASEILAVRVSANR